MKRVLVLDTNPTSIDYGLIDLHELKTSNAEIEGVRCIYQAIRMLHTSMEFSLANKKSSYDLLIIGITSAESDLEKITFAEYIKHNNPELPVILFLHKTNDLLSSMRIKKNKAPVMFAHTENIQSFIDMTLIT